MSDHYVHPLKKKRGRLVSYFLKYGLLLIMGGGLIAGGYIVTGTDYLKVRSLVITGIDSNIEAETLAEVKDAIPKTLLRNILSLDNYLAWPKTITLPDAKFRNIEINKRFFDRSISIDIVPRERYAIWCFLEPKEKCYWFDKDDGTLMEEAPFAKGQLVSRVIDSESKPLMEGDRVLFGEQLEAAVVILKNIQALSIPVDYIEIDRTVQELHAVSINGTNIRFNLRFIPDDSLFTSLDELLDETPLSSLEYIDLTVQNKIYLKPW